MRPIFQLITFAALMLQGTLCLAQARFPERPIRIVMPFSPGGGGDLSVRALQENLAKRLGVPIVIDNRPGASGFIGAQAVASSAPDGYTLLMGYDGSLAIATHILKPPFRPLDDLVPVTKLADSPLLLLAHPSVKAHNLKELIELSHREPKGLAYGSAGNGTTHHMVGELLAQRTGIKLQHIPYKGGSAAVTDAVAGQIPLVVTVLPTAIQFIKEGRLKAIAVTSRDRLPQLPEVPTVREQGVPDFEVVSWYSIFAPARTPRTVVDRLRSAFAEALSTASTRDICTKAGFVPVGNSPDEFRVQFRADYKRWAAVVKTGNIQAD